MNLYTFRHLSPAVQLQYVLAAGTLRGQRTEGLRQVQLYQLADWHRGFFVKVGGAVGQEPAVLRSFVDSRLLELPVPDRWLPECPLASGQCLPAAPACPQR